MVPTIAAPAVMMPVVPRRDASGKGQGRTRDENVSTTQVARIRDDDDIRSDSPNEVNKRPKTGSHTPIKSRECSRRIVRADGSNIDDWQQQWSPWRMEFLSQERIVRMCVCVWVWVCMGGMWMVPLTGTQNHCRPFQPVPPMSVQYGLVPPVARRYGRPKSSPSN
jgi:hypothetical protein